MDINRQPRRQSGGSMFSRGMRDLGTPQGLILFRTIILCAVFSIAFDIIGKRIGIKTDLLYAIIIVVNVVIFGVIVIRMSVMSKKALEKRRNDYQRKLEGKDKK